MTSILILTHQRPDGEVDTYHLKSGRRYHLGRGSQCQVRILDLKLSRQHCAFECGDQGWVVVDLASTNGCAVDGARVSGTCRLQVGSTVTAGTSSVAVDRILDGSEDPPGQHPSPLPATMPPPRQAIPATPAGGMPSPWPEQGEAEAPRASDRLAAMASRSSGSESDELEPQSTPNRVTQSDPLIPAPTMRPAPPAPEPLVDHDVLATLPPGHRAPAAPATAPATETAVEIGSRTFYINVLGRRVGPLTKAQARDLKTKELKGSLTPADLANVEAEASMSPPVASDVVGGDEQRTYYITLLGKRVGPLTRSQARELKARELRGMLPADEVERLLAR